MKTLSSIRLTDNQKRVMARILSAPTPKVAADDISSNMNMIGARNTLVNLGLIFYANDDAHVTDQGMEIMKSEALVDDSGQLSPDGQQLAATDPSGKPVQQPPQSPPQTNDITGEPAMPGPDQTPPGSLQLQHDDYFERLALLKELINS